MEKQYYIYIITNKINNKKYIGQHKGYPDDNYFGSGILITKAIEKYGKENFTKEIIEFCTKENIDDKEKYWINYYNAVENNNFYNQMEGGTGGDGWKACNKWMKDNPEKAQEIYAKNGARIKQWTKEHPEENKKHIKKMLESSHNYYTNHPEEITRVMNIVNKAKEQWQKEHPEEYQAQIKKWREAGNEANSKQIICLTTNEIFPSICEAARYYHTYQPNIRKAIIGERQSAGKHPITGEKLKWAYYEENLDV